MASPGCRRASSSTARCVTRAAGGTPRRAAVPRDRRPVPLAARLRAARRGGRCAPARASTMETPRQPHGVARPEGGRARPGRGAGAAAVPNHALLVGATAPTPAPAPVPPRPRAPAAAAVRGSDPGRRGAARARAGARAESPRRPWGPAARASRGRCPPSRRPPARAAPGARARARRSARRRCRRSTRRDGTGTRRARRGRRRLAPEERANGEDRAARSTQDPPGMQPLLASRGSRPMLSSAGGAHPSLRGCRVWVITTLPSHGRRTSE